MLDAVLEPSFPLEDMEVTEIEGFTVLVLEELVYRSRMQRWIGGIG
ncbi:MAG: hypothetical protein ACOC53_00880 [Candidatus Saliniplasma sp.]